MLANKLYKQEMNLDEKNKKHRLGALVLIFPFFIIL